MDSSEFGARTSLQARWRGSLLHAARSYRTLSLPSGYIEYAPCDPEPPSQQRGP